MLMAKSLNELNCVICKMLVTHSFENIEEKKQFSMALYCTVKVC